VKPLDCAVIGGGAAGFFGAITCAETNPAHRVRLCEAMTRPLAKVAISGGGRCNVTHACFDPARLVEFYPRGGRELLGPLHRWQPRDTLAWFTDRGVELKTEADGRIFPVTDQSATIINALLAAASAGGVRWATGQPVRTVERVVLGGPGGPGFRVHLAGEESFLAHRILLATGGGKGSIGLAVAQALGHTIEPPVPSLFSFHIADPRLHGLAGLSVADAGVRIGRDLAARGPILVTHWGLSGPGILKLSAWGAREMAASDYRFTVTINWTGERSRDEVRAELARARTEHPKRQVATWNPFGLPARLWDRLLAAAQLRGGETWSTVAKTQSDALAQELTAGDYPVAGKSMNKEEFVTCGGVRLSEVDFKTMESKRCPGLFLAGEVLDLDGLTGGFNLQAAWTTGRIAGLGLARALSDSPPNSAPPCP
jgi:predicted Rossmann fold flavoprotein